MKVLFFLIPFVCASQIVAAKDASAAATKHKRSVAQAEEPLALLSYIHVKPESIDLFKKEVAKIVTVSRAEEGNVAWFSQQSKDDPTQFVFYTRWKTEAALNFHLGSPPLVAYLKATEPFLAEPAKLVKFSPIDLDPVDN